MIADWRLQPNRVVRSCERFQPEIDAGSWALVAQRHASNSHGYVPWSLIFVPRVVYSAEGGHRGYLSPAAGYTTPSGTTFPLLGCVSPGAPGILTHSTGVLD